MQSAYPFRLLGGLALSAILHGAVAFAVSRAETPPPEPEPYALDGLSHLARGVLVSSAESARVSCAALPFLCQEEKFVELEVSETPEEVIETFTTDEPLLAANEPPKPEDPENPPPPVPEVKVEPDPPKPEEKKPEENLALVPTPPPPPVVPKERLKSVEQLVDQEDKVNPNAQFLAEKTKNVEEQTQAKVTSNYLMDKEAVASADSSTDDPEEGAEEKKIAGSEEMLAALTEKKDPQRKENKVDPAEVAAPQGAPKEKEGKKGTEGEKELSEDSIGESAVPVKRIGEEGKGGQGDAGSGKAGEQDPSSIRKGRPRLTLTMNDLAEITGSTPGAANGQEDSKSNSKGGKGDKRKKFVMAQLENYLPEVKPGNQTALSTAADPFAKFLHQVHLRIHDKWGDGVLRDFDKLGGTNPLNNPALLVTLEIVVKPDGTLEKAAPVGSSGYLPYDVAAVTALFDAAPFPKPPEAIRSYNGNVYLRWTLHRDTRQCATSFAEPFILTGPDASSTKPVPATPAPQ